MYFHNVVGTGRYTTSTTNMYFHNVVGTESYTTSTTNMYNKYQFHVPAIVGAFVRPTIPLPAISNPAPTATTRLIWWGW